RHTRLQGDWSSDVCSSDLGIGIFFLINDYAAIAIDRNTADVVDVKVGRQILRNNRSIVGGKVGLVHRKRPDPDTSRDQPPCGKRSEERRVGKERRTREKKI